MSQVERSARLPLALEVMREELAAIDAQFDAAATATGRAEKDARHADLIRALDRYLRLEREVLYPVLSRIGVEHASARASTEHLSSVLAAVSAQPAAGRLADLRSAFEQHWRAQERDTFPRAAAALGTEPGLAAELEEVRNRMKGAFGV